MIQKIININISWISNYTINIMVNNRYQYQYFGYAPLLDTKKNGGLGAPDIERHHTQDLMI